METLSRTDPVSSSLIEQSYFLYLTVWTWGHTPLICWESLQHFPHLLFLRIHGCHIVFLPPQKNKQIAPSSTQLFSGPRPYFRHASKYPNTKEALGLWFPFGPYFVKQRRVLCYLNNWLLEHLNLPRHAGAAKLATCPLNSSRRDSVYELNFYKKCNCVSQLYRDCFQEPIALL